MEKIIVTNGPLTDEQLWGIPEDDCFNENEADELLEEILDNTGREELGYENYDKKNTVGDCFDEAHYCPYCLKTMHLCQCDLINQGEDI